MSARRSFWLSDDRGIRKKKNKDIYIRTLLILLKTMNVSAKEFFSDPRFESEEPDIDFK